MHDPSRLRIVTEIAIDYSSLQRLPDQAYKVSLLQNALELQLNTFQIELATSRSSHHANIPCNKSC